MYSINITKEAAKDLKKLDSTVRLAAIRAMNQLVNFPTVTEIEPMKGHGMGVWRKKFRRDWRMIFFVDELRLEISIYRVGNRRSVYRDF